MSKVEVRGKSTVGRSTVKGRSTVTSKSTLKNDQPARHRMASKVRAKMSLIDEEGAE
jgi:hypothetical protein